MRIPMLRLKSLCLTAVCAVMACMLAACANINIRIETPSAASPVTACETTVSKNEEFGSINIGMTIEEFEAAGFSFGDSVDILFDNGTEYTDIPYYSGYFVPIGELVVCGYPGYEHPVIARNYGNTVWDELNLTDSSTVIISLNEKGRYRAVEEFNAMHYSDEHDDYETDIVFANFREIEGGDLKDDTFYRSASPCDDTHNRAACVDDLTEEHGIGFIINLADNDEKYQGYRAQDGFVSDHYDELYDKGRVMFLSLNANYRSDEFAEGISNAFYKMSCQSDPVLIHCLEGKDRTGFAATLLLALAQASPQEIIDDYMITYDNYYGITKDGDPDKYEAVVENVNGFLRYLCDASDGDDVSALDVRSGAENYLRRGGLNDEQIARIEEFISQ